MIGPLGSKEAVLALRTVNETLAYALCGRPGRACRRPISRLAVDLAVEKQHLQRWWLPPGVQISKLIPSSDGVPRNPRIILLAWT